jgi:hypothetical protein
MFAFIIADAGVYIDPPPSTAAAAAAAAAAARAVCTCSSECAAM